MSKLKTETDNSSELEESELVSTQKTTNDIETPVEIVSIDESDSLLKSAIELAIKLTNISINILQKELCIGYNRAGRLYETLISLGIIIDNGVCSISGGLRANLLSNR